MVNAAAAFAPVVCLLALLVVMDSFKLVPMRAVAQALGAGALAAGLALAINYQLLSTFGIPTAVVTRALAPLIEESLKVAFVAWAIHTRRVGFPVDAAILGLR